MKKRKFDKELEDFLDGIDQNTPEKIILQTSTEELKDPVQQIMHNVKARGILEGAALARAFSWEKGLMLLFLKNGKIYGLDWCDGYGVTICEHISPNEWSFRS